MKNTDDYIKRNIEIINAQGKRDCFFGTSYVQRLCHIGYNQACHTIEKALSGNIIKQNPDCEWEYSINQQPTKQ